ncbi:MAG: PilZ domain-containing protein [Burkholderiales bacterium]|jgi:hypothetical protein|nr:PilZ domain-containing protein [Burkholderiales bacterium]
MSSTAAVVKEQRSERYRTELSTTVQGVTGVTDNISATGFYILQDQACEVGSRIDFCVDLVTRHVKLKLSCEGEVVRVERVDRRFGIGVKVLSQVMQAVN